MRLLIAGFLCFMLLFFSTVTSAKIVFGSTRDDVRGIYVMDDDGGSVTLLTDALRPSLPRWSPDGKQIVFSRHKDQLFRRDVRVFLMNADGTNIQQLTTPPDNGYDFSGSFSPDGKSILFERLEEAIGNKKRKNSLNVQNLESENIKELVEMTTSVPDWSPDGKHIVFSTAISLQGLGSSIWIMEDDGAKPRKLVPSQRVGDLIFSLTKPRWSPDGKKLVYLRQEYSWEPREVKGQNVVALIRKGFRYIVCDRNGKTLQQLNIPKDLQPTGIDWMDKGKSVVFSARKYPLNELPPAHGQNLPSNIYKYHLRTGKITRLTEHPGHDHTLDWIDDHAHAVSPEGKQPMRWGALKSFLPVSRAVFKYFRKTY